MLKKIKSNDNCLQKQTTEFEGLRDMVKNPIPYHSIAWFFWLKLGVALEFGKTVIKFYLLTSPETERF